MDILDAIHRNDQEMFNALVETQYNKADAMGYSALHDAKTVEQAIALIKAGANVHAKTLNCCLTPLQTTKCSKIAKVLLEAGADPNCGHYMKMYPIFRASDPAMMEVLIKGKANVNIRGLEGITPLMEPRIQVQGVVDQLIKAGADVNAVDDYGRNALHYTTNPYHCACLIKAGANVNSTTYNYKHTPLYNVKNVECLKLLIDAGAKIEARSKGGRTPIFERQEYDIVKLFIDCGADVNAVDDHGLSVLFHVYSNNVKVKELLINAGAKE
jgi:ankyrin repeat protein